MKIIKLNDKIITGFTDGEEIATQVLKCIEDFGNVELEFVNAVSVGLSFVEGFVYKIKSNDPEILKLIKIRGNDRIKGRFAIYGI